ncbi:hypothetical protein CRV02_12905 [Arcobacter sp. CECT 8989]|uniref:SMEK domain-containing protein n=1 Tax=Arcobacter sp. CECT 8989 TaxID=2044509 RepID=UPI00100C1190|nr:SMEK domain-containing protein [Arcobacter sp. CECT 8989]RXJ98944.1 hypothetical protein CRV02_12905 [Arcobacter sp. CECT 8989]
MFKRKKLIEEIKKKLAYISIVIEYSNKINLYDLNIYSEHFFCGLLNLIYSYNLEDLNIKQKNFPAIDLGDYKNKICFQITSTNSKKKICTTIEKFEKESLYNNFDKLFILILKKKLSNYGTFKELTYFSKEQIIDFSDLNTRINKIKDTHHINKIYQYIEKNILKFENIDNPKSLLNELYSHLNNINLKVLDIKKSAFLQYEITNEKINNILKKIKLGKENLNTDDLQLLIKASQFLNTIDNDTMNVLSNYIILKEDTKYKLFTTYLINNLDMLEVKSLFFDSYDFERIQRLFEDIQKIINFEKNYAVSIGYGNIKTVNSQSIIVSVSSNDTVDNKLVILNSDMDYIIQDEICLGGISEQVYNIKTFFNNRYILSQSKYHLYLWDTNISCNVMSILINPNNIPIIDYQLINHNETIQVITLNENKEVTIWKLINYIPFIYKTLILKENANILIRDTENRLLQYSRYSKSIYQYDIKKETLLPIFKLPDNYDTVLDLTIHPLKNFIAFSHSEKKRFEFEEIIQFDIDRKIEFFREKFKNHFLINCEYKYINNNLQLLVYDRDGAGSNYSALLRAWIQKKDYEFLYCDSNDFDKEDNEFYLSLNFFNHSLYLIKSSISDRIYKRKNNKESLFYKVNKNYYIKEIYTK